MDILKIITLLALVAGGAGLCRNADGSAVFEDKTDPDYQKSLQASEVGKVRLLKYPRVDMMGKDGFMDACSDESKTLNDTEHGKHLFILSGQSNMARLNTNISFKPAVSKAFGEANVVVVKDAQGGQPIRRWYKDWKPALGDMPQATGDLYDRLMKQVDAVVQREQFATVTFVWMQGEKDAREKQGEVYAASLQGLFDQLSADLGRDDINFVIGRLSDFDMANEKYPHWTMVRKAQVEVARANPRGAWVNTDDLNDGKNSKGEQITDDLHCSVEGYRMLGERFAEKAIELIMK